MDDIAQEPKRIWWARPRKLCGLERPGGGGRSHRPERRDAPVESAGEGVAALDELLSLLRVETKRPGAVAVHGNRWTDFVAAVCAAHLHELRSVPVAGALAEASRAGLTVTPAACTLVGVDPEEVDAMLHAAA